MKLNELEIKKDQNIENEIKKTINCKMEDIIYKEIETKKTLFNTKKKYLVIEKKEIIECIKNEFNNITNLMNIETKIEVNEQNNDFFVKMDSKYNAILIGKNGKTLKSLLVVINKKIQKETKMYIKIILDIGNYKEKNEKMLEIMALKIADEVIKSGIEVKLDSMNSYQRRIIHNVLNNNNKIKTISKGEEPNRYIIKKKEEE